MSRTAGFWEVSSSRTEARPKQAFGTREKPVGSIPLVRRDPDASHTREAAGFFSTTAMASSSPGDTAAPTATLCGLAPIRLCCHQDTGRACSPVSPCPPRCPWRHALFMPSHGLNAETNRKLTSCHRVTRGVAHWGHEGAGRSWRTSKLRKTTSTANEMHKPKVSNRLLLLFHLIKS